jgi:hypothetical protein
MITKRDTEDRTREQTGEVERERKRYYSTDTEAVQRLNAHKNL